MIRVNRKGYLQYVIIIFCILLINASFVSPYEHSLSIDRKGKLSKIGEFFSQTPIQKEDVNGGVIIPPVLTIEDIVTKPLLRQMGGYLIDLDVLHRLRCTSPKSAIIDIYTRNDIICSCNNFTLLSNTSM